MQIVFESESGRSRTMQVDRGFREPITTETIMCALNTIKTIALSDRSAWEKRDQVRDYALTLNNKKVQRMKLQAIFEQALDSILGDDTMIYFLGLEIKKSEYV